MCYWISLIMISCVCFQLVSSGTYTKPLVLKGTAENRAGMITVGWYCKYFNKPSLPPSLQLKITFNDIIRQNDNGNAKIIVFYKY